MISLILCILLSSMIFVIFKLFPKYTINTFQAIVFNYVTAFSCGFLFYGDQWHASLLSMGDWPYYAVLAGFLFIGSFILLGFSSQRNGVAITSVAVKMSMALSMLFMIVLYNESLSFLKLIGIVFAFAGVLLMSYQKSEKAETKSATWLLLILFVGSATLDVVLNYVQKYELSHLSSSLFSACGFGISALIGISIMIVQRFRKGVKIEMKNIVAGICLGIPNYFSIFLLMDSYQSTGWNDSTVLAIMNVSIVLLSAIIGFVAFKENANRQKIVGLIVSLAAIGLLYFASL